jgi:stage II sporulation protein D
MRLAAIRVSIAMKLRASSPVGWVVRLAAVWTTFAACLLFAGPSLAASTFYIRGAGNGHGIGMSQYGAYGYALHGNDYQWILAHYYQGTGLGSTDPNQIVRVLLSTGQASFSGAAHAVSKRLDPNLTYVVRPNSDGSLTIAGSSGKKVGRFQAPLTVTGPAPLTLAGVGTYRGALVFRPDSHGGVQTVDALGLDDYVRGVISWEMPAGWSPEALDVQAVAARTYAITTNVGGVTYDLYSDTRSQMYGGVAAETPSTDAAVAATRGQIVTYGGAPAVTYFSASSGGQTENIENVWSGATPEPWLRGVPDPYDNAAGNPYYRWAYDVTVAKAAARLGSLVKGRLIGIQVVERGVSPRIMLADVVGTRGRTRVTGAQLQHIFGLDSTDVAFTTISVASGAPPGSVAVHSHPVSGTGGAATQAMMALVPLVDDLVAQAVPGLHGTVFPPASGAKLTVQARGTHGWQTVAHAVVGRGGAFGLELPGPGTYRVVYGALDGPAVTVP